MELALANPGFSESLISHTQELQLPGFSESLISHTQELQVLFTC